MKQKNINPKKKKRNTEDKIIEVLAWTIVFSLIYLVAKIII